MFSVLDIDSHGLDEQTVELEVSFNALSGEYHPSTLRLKGFYQGQSVNVLVDSGSTFNFIKPSVAQHLRLPSSILTPFKVFVGNGDFIWCNTKSSAISLSVQGVSFTVDLFHLNIASADVVFGVAWLRSLHRVLTDYDLNTIEFIYPGQPTVLYAETLLQANPINSTSVKRLLHSNNILLVCHMQLKHDPVANTPKDFSKQMQQLLDTFALVFIAKMLKSGIIRDSQSSFSSPVFLIKKNDGSWRFCVDYRALNAITIRDLFPIPTIEEILDELHGAVIFSKLDLRSGFHQIRMREEDIGKTAFRTHHGHYKFLVMPFGLTNAPFTFQSTMNKVFQPYIRNFVAIFFDDILIYSKSMEDHISHLTLVLDTLRTHKLFANLSKCEFCQESINYLGHVVSAQGVQVDTQKIDAVINWPLPQNITQLRGFLGLTGYYRHFVKGYASIAWPLTDMLKHNSFHWTPTSEQAFLHLKEALTTTPTLALPDFSVMFVIETDASNHGIGAVLTQKGHPLAYFSKKLSPKMAKASTYVRELYALTQAVARWRHYLLGKRFLIRTDHHTLKDLMYQVIKPRATIFSH
uniref:Retrovirus-related Pol polyprotein from transposon 297 family n=1 Tax=Cajanus cajan TaxID=3821 RepID=A0A151R7D5_CAJCA|nr:Retrovirus-related Pol polyprotein from transposon 297 family [Cajanus cajan]